MASCLCLVKQIVIPVGRAGKKYICNVCTTVLSSGVTVKADSLWNVSCWHTHEQKYAIVKPQKRSYGAHKGTLMEQQLQMKCNEMLLLGVVLKHFITLWYKAHSSTGRDIKWRRGGGLLSLSMYTGLRGSEFSSVSVEFLPLVFFSVLH